MFLIFLCHRCRFDEYFAINSYKPHPDNRRMLLSSNNGEKHPINIHFNFEPITRDGFRYVCQDVDQTVYGFKCEDGDIVTPERFEILNGTLRNIGNYLGKLLSVKSLGSLRITAAGDGLNGRVVNGADLIVNVYVRPYGANDVLAQAVPTRYGPDGRPVEGSIYINLKELPAKITDIDSPNRFFLKLLCTSLFMC